MWKQYLGAADVLEYVGSWPYVVPPVHRIKPGRLTQTDCRPNIQKKKYFPQEYGGWYDQDNLKHFDETY